MPTYYAPATSADLATISLKKLASSNESERLDEIARLSTVCKDVGFFYISDHGVCPEFLDRMFAAAHAFFELPHEVKSKWDSSKQVFEPRTLRGYHAIGTEQLNQLRQKDVRQSFDLGPDRPHVPGIHFTGPTIAPSESDAPGFMSTQRELLEHCMRTIIPVLARALALGLGEEENLFEKNMAYDEMIVTQRVTHYPPRNGATGRHTDSGLFTLLFVASKDAEGSLKMFSHGKWRNVTEKRDLILVNLGNCLQLWSGDRYVSTPHEVVHQSASDRMSVPVFVYPKADTCIVSPNDPSRRIDSIRKMYVDDLDDIWKSGKGAGDWNLQCKMPESDCDCWKCN